MTRFGLTRAQQRALDILRQWHAQHGRMPAVREFARALGLRGHSNARRLLMQLTARGHIERLPRQACAIAFSGGEQAAPALRLPAELWQMLEQHCRTHGERPEDVVADAVRLHFDALGPRHGAADIAAALAPVEIAP